MSRVLIYVEIDIPAFTQSSPDSPETELTIRFTTDTDYLPLTIPAIPSIVDVSIQPGSISLGENLGERTVVTITLRDHRHIFDAEDFDSGTFWGKFRARYGLTLQGNPLRLIRGSVGQDLEDMETRHYLIDAIDGPDRGGIYKIIAKDILTFANGDRAQAPRLSEGFLAANITVTTAPVNTTLSPSGIGSTYPSAGLVAIGGKELAQFSRSGDVLTLNPRGFFNTIPQTHTAGDRVQLCLQFTVQSASQIIHDLLVDFAGVDEDFIPLSEWEAETSAFLNVFYTTCIANPVEVNKLLSEIIEQAALALWWDDVRQQIRLQVLRQIPTGAATYDQSNTLQGTFEVTEQPEKRLSDVQVYFAKINPLVQDDEDDNYSSSALVQDDLAIQEYGSALIKKIRSRWIPTGGRATAETLANKQLGRFRDPPRLTKFEIMRDQELDPELGGGYQLGGTPFQTITGASEMIPVQIIRLDPRADYFAIEAEEALWSPFGGDIDPNIRTIVYDVNTNNVNLRTSHDILYPAPESGNVVSAFVLAGVIIGSVSTASRAFDVGTWPAGVSITLTVLGRIQGAAGNAGGGGNADLTSQTVGAGANGLPGGIALYTRQAITLVSTNGQIWAGAGGGGGGGGSLATTALAIGGGGGGGGCGTIPGLGGGGGIGTGTPGTIFNGSAGNAGTSETGGTGGGTLSAATGGAGGGPGLAGSNGNVASTGVVIGSGGTGGAVGTAIDGDSFVTDSGAPGDIRGPQIN